MAYHPYRVQSIEDEKRLLQKMLALEDKVRVTREKDRRLKVNQNRHYSRMFRPITNSLQKITKPAHVLSTTTTVEQPVPIKSELTDDEEDVKDEEADDKDNDYDHYNEEE